MAACLLTWPPVRILESPAALREAYAAAGLSGGNIGFVPTMGALHAGHLALIRQAAAENPAVVVSIFVNPTQFAPEEDFARYPRPITQDIELARAAGAAFVFTPSASDLYPANPQISVRVGPLGAVLEGERRPHFFHGVATVVLKLLQIVQPGRAYFGKKDYQQTVVVRRLVEECFLPVEIRLGETVREPSGLALSSRNAYLSAAQREAATLLYKTLQAVKHNAPQLQSTEAAFRYVEGRFSEAQGVALDYFAVRAATDFRALETLDPAHQPVALLAARIGDVRLLDNLELFAA